MNEKCAGKVHLRHMPELDWDLELNEAIFRNVPELVGASSSLSVLFH